MNVSELKLVTLHNPLSVWQHPEVPAYFDAYISCKKRGYEKEYGTTVLPFGSYDFISTLYLVGAASSKGFTPFGVAKSVSTSACARYQLPFEITGILKQANANPLLLAFEELQARLPPQDRGFIFYLSSLTVDPEIRKDKASAHLIRRAIYGAFVNHLERVHAKCTLTAGSVKFKIHEDLLRSGFQPLELNGTPLPPFPSPFLKGTESFLMSTPEFKGFWKECSEEFTPLWDQRISWGEEKGPHSIGVEDERAA